MTAYTMTADMMPTNDTLARWVRESGGRLSAREIWRIWRREMRKADKIADRQMLAFGGEGRLRVALVLQPAYADTYIRDAAPTSNYATNAALIIGDISTALSSARVLLKFDLSAIPSNAVIVSAMLSLYEYEASNTVGIANWSAGLRRVLRNWTNDQATWNNFSNGNPWTIAGCNSDGNDRAAIDSATVTLDGTPANGFVDWSGSTLIDDVQKMVSGTYSNYGWLLQAPNAELTSDVAGKWSYNSFRSSDYATTSQRPKLTITYDV